MGKVYESLRDAVQETLHLNKTGSIGSPLTEHADALGLGQELKELQKVVLDRIGRLAVLVENDEKLAKEENQHAEQLITGLRENLTTATAKLRETENILNAKDSARHNLEDTLTGKIHGLQNDVRKKDEIIERKETEINNLTSRIDSLEKQVLELESSVEQARSEAAKEIQRAEQLSGNLRATTAELETQLKEAEQIVREKDSAIKTLEQELNAKVEELSAKILDFQNQVRHQEQLLGSRDAEIKDLRSQLQYLTRGIDEMSSFFMQAKAYAASETKEKNLTASDPLNKEGEKSSISMRDSKAVASPASVAEHPVSADLFHRVIERLTLTIGPVAPMVIRDHVVALGESIENFPKSRLIELVEILSNEIPNKDLRFSFRKWFAQQSLQ
jgi:chromosome segregation ATPase